KKEPLNTTPQITSVVQFQSQDVNETAIINRLFPNYLEESFGADGNFVGISKSDGYGDNGTYSLEAVESYQVGEEGQLHLIFWENVNIHGDLMIEPVWEVDLDSTSNIHYCEEENLIRYGGGQFQWEKPNIESLLRLSDGSIRLTMEQSWTHEASNTKSSEKTMYLLDQGQISWIFDYISFEGYQDFLLKDQLNSNKERLQKMIDLIPNQFYTGMVNEMYSKIEFSENYTQNMPDLIVTIQSFELNDAGDRIVDSESQQVWQFDGKRYVEMGNSIDS
ncbi:MAG: hypothetical protein AAF598_12025, partial [Bacteroidota bacterium]